MAKGTRLPEDWQPSPELLRYAASVGVTDIQRMTLDFTEYWWSVSGARATHLRWDMTWKRWARQEGDKCREKAARAQRYARPSASYQRNADQAHAEMHRILFEEPSHGADSHPADYSRRN